uniref:Large ribosomal subunit protein bL17m n=1 Tax=Pavo cristatus TaxID=9049 RepID=A0A8C9FSR7_PAVCR
MRMADFWLTEKDLIHKLFKVLAPRYQPHPGSYTRMLHIPNRDCLDRAKMAVIELKGNPFPPLIRPRRDSEKTLLNQLLKAACAPGSELASRDRTSVPLLKHRGGRCPGRAQDLFLALNDHNRGTSLRFTFLFL